MTRKIKIKIDGKSYLVEVKDINANPIEMTVDGENVFAWKVARHLNYPNTGGSDAHSIHGLGRCTTVFEDHIRSEEEFIEALRSGRFYAAHGMRSGTPQAFFG